MTGGRQGSASLSPISRPTRFEVLEGQAETVLRDLPAASVQMCVTSPPYFGQRDYDVEGQIGLEQTPAEYVARLVAVFDEVRRVLRPDGTLWLNLGDSYANDAKWGGATGGKNNAALHGNTGVGRGRRDTGLPAKSLIGMPWRVAFALQDAGWVLRKDIIWHKPNPTPESVRDRPTSSHEYVFLFAPDPLYHYDEHGWREKSVADHDQGNGFKRPQQIGHAGRGARGSDVGWTMTDTRNARDVWSIQTVPFPDTHFAVFPPELPRRCILLGSSPRACPDCGGPWVRMLEREDRGWDGSRYGERALAATGGATNGGTARSTLGSSNGKLTGQMRTVGWRPSCTCHAPASVRPRDLEIIYSPRSDEDGEPDPSLLVGRAGLARPRAEDAGVVAMTRWEQRHLAAQLVASPHRAAMAEEAGAAAFAHYRRTDRIGARAIRPQLLELWRDRGWLVDVPPIPPAWWRDDDAGRCVVLDPFAGSGTTGRVALDEGRDFIGIELSPVFAEMSRRRVREIAAAPRFELLA